jgi:hypothetical protein
MGIRKGVLNKIQRAKENIAAAQNKQTNTTGSFKKIRSDVVAANANNQKLDSIEVENASQLIKYRQNITVPAVWVPQQGVRAANLGRIPAENIFGLDTYITDNVKRIDGGDLDNPA